MLLPTERSSFTQRHTPRHIEIVLGLFGINGLPRKEDDREKRQLEQAQKPFAIYLRSLGALLDSIDTSTVVGLRDRALIGLMVYSFARIGAALGMTVEDVFTQNRRLWVRLREKGGKRHAMPCHHALAEALRAYIGAAHPGRGGAHQIVSLRGSKNAADHPA